jgi:hypothetical protein
MADDDEPAKHLGDCCETISFSRVDVVAGILIIAMTGVPGIMLLIAVLRAAYLAHWALPSWIGVGIGSLVGISLIVTGMSFAKTKCDQLTHRFDFCVNGFRYFFRGALDRVLWSQVLCIRETVSPLSQKARRRYKIATVSGKEYDIEGGSRAIREFGEMLRVRAKELSLPWETVDNRNDTGMKDSH